MKLFLRTTRACQTTVLGTHRFWVNSVIAVATLSLFLDPIRGGAANEANLPAVYSMSEIREELAKSRSRMRSLRVDFKIQVGPDAKVGPDGDDVSYHTFVARGIQRFTDNSHATRAFPRELDLNHHRAFYTGNSLSVYYVTSHYYETAKRDHTSVYTWKVRMPIILECIGWWPPDDPTKFPGPDHPFLIHQAIEQGKYQVLPQQEVIDGAPCHVIAYGDVDRMWLDPAIGFGIRRRKKRIGATPSHYVQFELSDYRQESPQVWFPRRIRCTAFHSDVRREQTSPKVEADHLLTITRVEVNDVSGDWFHFTPSPGTLVRELDSGKNEQVPGGLWYLDSVVSTAGRITAIEGMDSDINAVTAQSVARTRSVPRQETLVLFSIAMVLALADVVALYRLYRLRNSLCSNGQY